MEGSFDDRKRRHFRLGVGLLGFILLISLAYSQLSYDTYTQASTRTRQLQTRLDDFLAVRGKVNGVVEALSDSTIPFANPSLAIDGRVWNMQTAWTDFRDDSPQPWPGARLLTPSPSALDAAMDQFALAALRNAAALRRNSSRAVGQQPQTALQISAGLEPQLKAMQRQITEAIETGTAKRDRAMAGFGYGRSLAYGAFFALSSLLAIGLLVSGARSFKNWIGREPVATISADKLASPQR